MDSRTSTLRMLIRPGVAIFYAFALLPARSQAAPPQYTVTVLGPLNGGANPYAHAVNDSGQVAGGCTIIAGNASRAVRWTGTTPTDLGTLGGTHSAGAGINASGQVAGTAYIAGNSARHAVRWTGTTPTVLSGLGGSSDGADINASGQVTGHAYISGYSGARAVRWTGTTPTVLGGLGDTSYGRGINASGQVAGTAHIASNGVSYAVRWTGTTPTVLGTLGRDCSFGRDINDSGQVVGGIYNQEPYDNNIATHRAVRWTGTIPTILGTLGAGTVGVAINASGDVVGISYLANGVPYHYFFYSGGTMYDLNDLLAPGSGFTEIQADYDGLGINNFGQIVAHELKNGQRYLLLLTPTRITFHRLTEVSHAANPSAEVDAPIQPVADATLLNTLPTFPGGLVADGVTPWLIKFTGISANYTLSFTVADGVLANRPLANRVHVLGTGGWSPGFVMTTVPPTPNAYAYIEGIAAEEIVLDPGKSELTVTVTLRNSANVVVGTDTFKIRKPPLVLAHGMNSDASDWGPDFVTTLGTATHPDFIRRINYGVDSSVSSEYYPNTTRSLPDLAGVLDQTLKNEEDALHAAWAFTCYDIVGHSQGGVLARMLCSKFPFGTQAFRNAGNFNRGRFRRIITIGSPHNGSMLVFWSLALREQGPPETFLNFAARTQAVRLVILPKFDPFGKQINLINSPNRQVDDAAKFHCVRTTIPFITNTQIINPPYSIALGLPLTISGTTQTIGQVLLPQLSDGGVDFESQGAGFGTPSTMVADNIAHSARYVFWGVFEGAAQHVSPLVASKIVELLTGPSTSFGKFQLPTLLGPDLADALKAIRPTYIHGDIAEVVGQSPPFSQLSRVKASTTAADGAAVVAETFNLLLHPLSSDPLQGKPTWFAQVFGPNGETTAGVAATVDTLDPTKATAVVDAAVQGDVVVSAVYSSTTGKVVVSDPILVVSRPPGGTLTAITLEPASTALRSGDTIYSQIWGLYDNGTKSLQFVHGSAPAQFTILGTSVATVDQNGVVSAVNPGTTTLTATFRGLTAQTMIAVNPTPTTFTNWLLENFTAAQLGDPTISGPTADPDNNGIPNLAEYAFGLNLNQASAGQLPRGQILGGSFFMNFTQPAGITDIAYGAEWSTTLLPGSWSPIPDTGTPPQHIFSVPIGTNTKLFMRHVVTTP